MREGRSTMKRVAIHYLLCLVTIACSNQMIFGSDNKDQQILNKVIVKLEKIKQKLSKMLQETDEKLPWIKQRHFEDLYYNEKWEEAKEYHKKCSIDLNSDCVSTRRLKPLRYALIARKLNIANNLLDEESVER